MKTHTQVIYEETVEMLEQKHDNLFIEINHLEDKVLLKRAELFRLRRIIAQKKSKPPDIYIG
jgi:hypothetical protein